MTIIRRLLVASLILAPANAVWAHHSFAMFDQTRKVTIQGTVKSLEWQTPHIWVWVDVDDGKGGTAPYAFESHTPAELTRFFGWTKRSMIPGDKITVEYSPLRSGKNGGALGTITFPDGRQLLTPRSGPPPASNGVPSASSGDAPTH
jgi:hypothetical protein